MRSYAWRCFESWEVLWEREYHIGGVSWTVHYQSSSPALIGPGLRHGSCQNVSGHFWCLRVRFTSKVNISVWWPWVRKYWITEWSRSPFYVFVCWFILTGAVKIFFLCCSSSMLFLLSPGSWVRWPGERGEWGEGHRQRWLLGTVRSFVIWEPCFMTYSWRGGFGGLEVAGNSWVLLECPVWDP